MLAISRYCKSWFNVGLIGDRILLTPQRHLSNRNGRGGKQKFAAYQTYIEITLIKPILY